MDQTALEDFSAEILMHGILSPLLVKTTPEAGFELVAGERRLRAALMAGLSSVPVLVAQLDDEMVCEVQLAENLQRESPHPLHESQAIARMQQAGKTIDEIAARLVSPKSSSTAESNYQNNRTFSTNPFRCQDGRATGLRDRAACSSITAPDFRAVLFRLAAGAFPNAIGACNQPLSL